MFVDVSLKIYGSTANFITRASDFSINCSNLVVSKKNVKNTEKKKIPIGNYAVNLDDSDN